MQDSADHEPVSVEVVLVTIRLLVGEVALQGVATRIRESRSVKRSRAACFVAPLFRSTCYQVIRCRPDD